MHCIDSSAPSTLACQGSAVGPPSPSSLLRVYVLERMLKRLLERAGAAILRTVNAIRSAPTTISARPPSSKFRRPHLDILAFLKDAPASRGKRDTAARTTHQLAVVFFQLGPS